MQLVRTSIVWAWMIAPALVWGCEPEIVSRPLLGKDSGSEDKSASRSDATLDAAGGKGQATSIWEQDPTEEVVDDRSDEEIVCQDGAKIANAPGYDDFTKIFGVICSDGHFSEDYLETVGQAYEGAGEGKVHIIEFSTDETFVTKLFFMYAIRAPLASPAQFSDMKIFDRLDGEGIENGSSRLTTNVLEYNTFPGRGSVEEYVLEHHLQLAEGAALHDVRKTSLNNYLFAEDRRDLTLTTEHLLDADNEFYHVARGIMIGIKDAEPGFTNLVYINEFVVKNRIDPVRLKNTLVNLSLRNEKIIYEQTQLVAAGNP